MNMNFERLDGALHASRNRGWLRKESEMYKTITIAALAGMSAASYAGDQTAKQVAPASTTMSFEQLDADRDGAISLAEGEKNGWAKTRFETGDKNADGRLDRAEFDALKS